MTHTLLIEGDGGPLAVSCAQNLVRDDYTARDWAGMPIRSLAIARLADAIVTDMTGVPALNDRAMRKDRLASLVRVNEANAREHLRLELRAVLSALDDADFRALVDRLAGLPSVQAA